MSSRAMKYPYTWSAKIAQFPLRYHFENSWLWKYWAAGILVSLPVFMKISKLSNSPENKKQWAETQRKALEKEHH